MKKRVQISDDLALVYNLNVAGDVTLVDDWSDQIGVVGTADITELDKLIEVLQDVRKHWIETSPELTSTDSNKQS